MRPLALLCRQQQMAQAAIVLSCIPAERPVLLLVMEPEPYPHAQYRERFAEFRQVFDARNELIGGAVGWETAGEARQQQLLQLQRQVDAATERLTSYRSWFSHQMQLRDLARRLDPIEALALFDPDDGTLAPPGISDHQIDDRTTVALLPEALRVDRLELPDGAPHPQWAEAAWGHFHPDVPLPAVFVDCPLDDPAACLSALRTALDRGCPLRPAIAAATSRARARVHSACLGAGDPSEVVLIEAANEADLLLGVLYARQRRLGLIAYAAPDIAPVRLATEAVEAARLEALRALQAEAAAASGESSKRRDTVKLFDGLWHWFAQVRAGSMAGLVDAVTKAVPAAVTKAVGGAAVTVLTGGIPYRFVRRRGADWSQKPIGHIVGDRSLLLLNAMHPKHTRDAPFDMMFGHAEFPDETRDVLNALEGRRAYALLLDGAAGSSTSLLHLPQSLPVELIFFNTHGGKDSIVLSDRAMPSFKLSQWLRLPSRPVVFNNSCLSWLGVGTEFVRCGAQGYVGTLWSVNADEAGTFARQAIERMVRAGAECSRALCDSGVAPLTSQAYLFVGAASQRLLAGEPSSLTVADRARSHANSLLSAANGLLSESGILSPGDHRRPALAMLLTEADRMIVDVDSVEPAAEATMEVLVERIEVLAKFPDVALRETRAALLTDAEQRHGGIDGANAISWRLARQRAVWLLEGGDAHAALAHVAKCTVPEDANHWAALAVEGQRSDLYKLTGDAKSSLAAAHRAVAISERADGDQRSAIMMSLGRVVQASLRLDDLPGAFAAAERGLKLAQQLHHDVEETAFELDLARLHLRSGAPASAEPLARAALKRTRQDFDTAGELSAVGTLCLTLIALHRLEEASELAAAGSSVAAKLNRMGSVADFLGNMAQIDDLRGRHDAAFGHMLKAGALFGRHGPPERLNSVFAWAHRWADLHGGPDAALRIVQLSRVVAAQGNARQPHWQVAADGIRTAVAWAQARTAVPPAELLMPILGEGEKDASPAGHLLSLVLYWLLVCAVGDAERARAAAGHLDDATGTTDFSPISQTLLERWHPALAMPAPTTGETPP